MDNRVVMISGTNRGIGAAVAEKLGGAGFSLSLGVRSEAERERVASLFPEERVLIAPYDAKIKEAAAEWVSITAEKFGRVDGLVNAAGILRSFQFEKDDEQVLDEMIEVNLKGPMRVMRQAFPWLRRSGQGRVVNIVSLSGIRVKGASAGYAMTKFACQALTQSARFAGWDDGVRVTALCPGWVNTEMVSHVDAISQEDMIQPETIADAILFLLNLPNNSSVATLPINCVLESTV